MKFKHAFIVRASLERVVAFHHDPRVLGRITPPPVVVRLHRLPPVIEDGAEMAFTLWLGPLPVRWLAHFEEVSPAGFVDRQIRGPFRKWVHRHRFVPLGENRTEIQDEVEVEIRLHPLWGPVGWSMWLSFPLLFAYREWRTRRLLG